MNCPFKFDCFQQTYICRHLLFHRLVKKEALFEKEMMPRRFWSLNTQEERNDIKIEEHTLFFQKILAAWLTSPKHRFFNSKRRPEASTLFPG